MEIDMGEQTYSVEQAIEILVREGHDREDAEAWIGQAAVIGPVTDWDLDVFRSAVAESDDAVQADDAAEPRYTVAAGSYRGGSDDVAGRWYIHDAEAGAIDKRGPGYATRADALAALVDQLTMYPEPAELVGTPEIATRAGVSQATVHSWRRRHADFPEPVVRLASGPVWDWREVAAWVARPRPTGRPRNA